MQREEWTMIRRIAIHDVLLALCRRDLVMLIMRGDYGMTYEEMATAMRCSRKTIQRKLPVALHNLLLEIERQDA